MHYIFHSEHNRLVDQAKDTVLASARPGFLNEWLLTPVAALPTSQAQIDALLWNGERLFQVAKFGTEMQYQHLVFEEFARTIQPLSIRSSRQPRCTTSTSIRRSSPSSRTPSIASATLC